MAIDERKIINGTHGTVFLDGEEVAEVKSFQAKLEFQKEEVKIAGKMATGTKYMGYSGKGSLALHKVNSRMIKAIGQQIKEGKEPRFTIIGKLADPDSDGVERIAINNVSFDDLTLFDFEVGALGQAECPFTFTDYDFLDLIAQKKWLKDNTNLDINNMSEQEIKEANTQSNVFIATSLKVVDAMEDILVSVEI